MKNKILNMPAGLAAVILLLSLHISGSDGGGSRRRSASISIQGTGQLADFDCPEEFGYYPHPSDCTQYYVCVFGGALLESCTGGLQYSHELQTCDWPRNVGCSAGASATAVQPSRSRDEQPPSREEIRVSRVQQQQVQPQQVVVQPVVQTQHIRQRQQQIPKHDLYTEEELGPAEEIETDRQQRVYRGQPSTIGQVQSDRDAISTHSNAIPVSSSGRENSKLSVVSYGAQQQYNRASLANQNYDGATSAAPVRAYNTTQYLAQYDPYYQQYEDQQIYKDIAEYTVDGQDYRVRDKKPQVEIVEQERYKSKYTTQQDTIYQPIPQDYQTYTVQNDDDVYRQQVQTKQYNRSGDARDAQDGGGQNVDAQVINLSPEISLNSSPSKLTAQQVDSTIQETRKPQRILNPVNVVPDYQRTVLSQTPRPFQRAEISTRPKELEEGFKHGLQINRLQSESASLDDGDYYNYESPSAHRSNQARISGASNTRKTTERNFVILVDEDRRRHEITRAPEITTRRISYETIQLPSSRQTSRTTENTRSPFRFVVNPNDQEQQIRLVKTEEPIRTTPTTRKLDVPTQYTPRYLGRLEQTSTRPSRYDPTTEFISRFQIDSQNINELASDVYDSTTEYVLRYPSNKQLPSRNSEKIPSRGKQDVTTEYNLRYLTNQNRATPKKYESNTEYSPRYLINQREPALDRTKSTKKYDTSEYVSRQTERPTERTKNTKTYEAVEYTPRFVTNSRDEQNERAKPIENYENDQYLPKYLTNSKDTRTSRLESNTEYSTKYLSRETDVDVPTVRQETKNPTTEYVPKYISQERSTEPRNLQNIQRKTIDTLTLNRPSYLKPKIEITPILNNSLSQNECYDCTEKPVVRVKPVSYDTQTTPGLSTRGSTRGRGSATYVYNQNEAEPPTTLNRGTPAVSRSRPTLKPSQSIVSKASEYVDIYRFPPRRPDPIYPTPTPDKTAAKCRKDVCLLPDCYCGGKEVPGEIPVEQTPQIVLLTFDDSVNDLNKGLYQDLFEKGRTNPNGCPISATFYVSHEWTDYSQVQNLYSSGHEIASHSVSHSFGEQFSQKKWTREIAGQREILAAYGGVKQEDIRGMRAPFLAIGGNKMFKMLYDANFTYDSSMPVYENRPPSWPYTMDYKIFHDCMIPPCPSKSYPGVWEVPMVMWQDLNGGRCSMGDACSNPPASDGVYKMLIKNFERHFTTNRAPFGLFYHAAWFTQPHHKEGFIAFLDTITQMPEVWLVTNWQAIQWVRDPTPMSRLNNFQPFQCNYQDRPKKCTNPKVCNLWHKSGVRYMRTCQACPEVYPWTGKTGVRNSRVDNEVFQE